jgi:hypothetical protein
MATPQHAGYEQRGSLGRISIILGSVAMLCDLAFLAQPLERMAERLHEGLFAVVPSLGLSFLSAARALARLLLTHLAYLGTIHGDGGRHRRDRLAAAAIPALKTPRPFAGVRVPGTGD